MTTTQQHAIRETPSLLSSVKKNITPISLAISLGLCVSIGLLYLVIISNNTLIGTRPAGLLHEPKTPVHIVAKHQTDKSQGIYLTTTCVRDHQVINKQVLRLLNNDLELQPIHTPCQHWKIGPFLDTKLLARWRVILTKLTGQAPVEKIDESPQF